ncbi:MAG: hypothetical protein COB54_09095 [Alphaproteobacteria bacterium]|nr:MAG: hypothetical protein COB54_09095 [Alphaproteobacteria bacterium]
MTWKDFPNFPRPGRVDYLTLQDGHKLRTACWPAEEDSRGIIVLVNGHREYMEKYSEFISDLLARGFSVYTLDNRGQGLSDRLLPNRLKSYSENFDCFSNDLNEFVSNIVMKDPRVQDLPLYLVGHSMGSHVCLRYLHDFPGAIDKAVIMAPMIDFNLGNALAKAVTKFVIRMVVKLGGRKNFAFGQGFEFSHERHLIKQKLLTHDDDRYAQEVDIIGTMPDLYVGGATFGWLNAAMDSMEEIQQQGYLEKITTPMLVVLAGADQVVDSQASIDLFSGADDNIRLVTVDGARHEMYRESDIYRDPLWQEIDGFLGVQ